MNNWPLWMVNLVYLFYACLPEIRGGCILLTRQKIGIFEEHAYSEKKICNVAVNVWCFSELRQVYSPIFCCVRKAIKPYIPILTK